MSHTVLTRKSQVILTLEIARKTYNFYQLRVTSHFCDSQVINEPDKTCKLRTTITPRILELWRREGWILKALLALYPTKMSNGLQLRFLRRQITKQINKSKPHKMEAPLINPHPLPAADSLRDKEEDQVEEEDKEEALGEEEEASQPSLLLHPQHPNQTRRRGRRRMITRHLLSKAP